MSKAAKNALLAEYDAYAYVAVRFELCDRLRLDATPQTVDVCA
jgi:hypothetical protein